MDDRRTPFLAGALGVLYPGEPPDSCPECGYSWSTSPADAMALVAGAPDRIGELLDGRDGMVARPDGSWNATAYVWHLADLAESWSERWIQISAAPGSRLVGWDPDQLADVRGYRSLPTAPGMWALRRAVATLGATSGAVGFDAEFLHGDWGIGSVGDAIVWVGHEFAHHELDIDRRAR